ncbi:MAG: AAA family ATPase [Bilifractor sp.]|jgi:Mrp family chromosome partitioning ATPase
MEQKPQMVIIDTDYDYLRGLEEDIIRRFSVESDIQIITDPGYVETYFSKEHTIDLLIVDDENYSEQITGQKIGKIFLLTGNIDTERVFPDHVQAFLKNGDNAALLQEIENVLQRDQDTEEVQGTSGTGEGQEQTPERKETKIVGVYSPIGGCGKSLISVALARKLKMLDQKVLVIGCDPTQSVSVFFDEDKTASSELAEKLKNPDEDTYWTILQNIGTDEVSYLLPFGKSLKTMGLHTRHLKVLLDILKDKKDFDFIILDVGSQMSQAMSEILDQAKAMILVTEPNEIASRKMRKLLSDADALPTCECILLSNEYHSDGMRIPNNTVFGTILTHPNWMDAEEDPVFYNVALKLTE